MKLLVVGVSIFLSLSTLAAAGGAPPPRMPSPEGQQQQNLPETAAQPVGEQEVFMMPSGNIGCVYTPAGGTAVYQPQDGGPELACDIVAPRYVRATLGRSGAATLNHAVGDPSLLLGSSGARLWAKLVTGAVRVCFRTHRPFLSPRRRAQLPAQPCAGLCRLKSRAPAGRKAAIKL